MKINNDTREVIENDNMELTDEELDKVSGGSGDDGDNTKCSWNPYGSEHEWEEDGNGRQVCKYCGVYIG